MSKSDKTILFVTKFIIGSLMAGFVSAWFLTVGMTILGVNFDSKINVPQGVFLTGFVGIPYYGSIVLAKWVEKSKTE